MVGGRTSGTTRSGNLNDDDNDKSAWSLGFHSECNFSDVYVSVQPSGRLTTASTATTAATSVTCMATATWRDTDVLKPEQS
jgi:hypothetical protein